MDPNTAKSVASALRYSQQGNQQTVSTHEPELLLKVVDGHEIRQSLPRRRDHSGACQIEIDVLQHHHPTCEKSKQQNITGIPSDDIQGSFLVLERLPVATCENKDLLLTKPSIKKPGTIPNPVSKFSVHDEHAILHGSRKGTRLNEPEAFDACFVKEARSTIENVALLPKLGCSQPSFVARVEQKLASKSRYDPSADPARKSKTTIVNTASTHGKKTPFDASDAGKTTSPYKSNTNVNVYNTNTNNSTSAFDRKTGQTRSNKGLVHTCVTQPDNSLVYHDKDGNRLPQDSNPFDTADKKQSVYAVVSKTSRVSFGETTSQKSKLDNSHDRGIGTYQTFRDPCFGGPIVMTTSVPRVKLPTQPKPAETNKTQCCPPDCDIQVIGKPKENFKEESGSEDDMHTVMTDTTSRADTALSRDPYYTPPSREPQAASDGCFKKVFLCGACRKKPEPRTINSTNRRTGNATNVPTQRPASITKSNNSQTPSTQTNKSAVSHSKYGGHNAEMSHGSISKKTSLKAASSSKAPSSSKTPAKAP